MSWQKILAQGFATAHELLEYLHLPTDLASTSAEKLFKTKVPRGFAARMTAGDPKDPLLLQVLGGVQELEELPQYIKDPLKESAHNPIPGLIHKYKGRVLMLFTGACAIHCRYCFRRNFPYTDNQLGQDGWQRVFDYIKKDTRISELILSGGDPLLAKDAVFARFLQEIGSIKHLKTLRFHSRIPIVLPERISDVFISLFKALPLRKVMVLHSNHAKELSESVREACKKLQEAGFYLLNQTVLLRQVNDDADILTHLCERLFDFGVLPYYLHLLDKVSGAHHFDVPLQEACSIYKQLHANLPGYLVPRLVREEAGKEAKTLVACDHFSDEQFRVS